MVSYIDDESIKSNDLISIIVPVYKVEPFLCRCIDSILTQTYSNLEIILIDDGSPDQCGIICEEYSKADRRIRILHTDNRGLSAARNLGLQESKGCYIGFVDSDDWIEPDMYEILLKALEDTGSDICECGLWNEFEDRSELYEDCGTSQQGQVVYDTKEALSALIEEKIASPVWNKLFKKTVFDTVYFPEGKNYEDVVCMHKIIGQSQRYVKINIPKYHYRQRSESISQTRTAQNLIDYAYACLDRQKYMEKTWPELYEDKRERILLFSAKGISRVWRWWHKCSRYEKHLFQYKINDLTSVTRNQFPMFGYHSWPVYLRISVAFMHSNSEFSFSFLYMISQMYRNSTSIKKVKEELGKTKRKGDYCLLPAIKKNVKRSCPRVLMKSAATVVRSSRAIWYRANMRLFPGKMDFYCSCCNTKLERFATRDFARESKTFDSLRYQNTRQDVICPVCHAFPRHRILALWCDKHKDYFQSSEILWFAPEQSMMRWMKRRGVTCTTADLHFDADLKLDIQDTHLPDASYDIVIANHVLEHVVDFRIALREMYRILKTSGMFICSFPMDPKIELLDEEEEPLSADERLKRFGQNDHKRVFGMKADQFLTEAGFEVEMIKGEDYPDEILPVVGPADYDMNILFCCRKPL